MSGTYSPVDPLNATAKSVLSQDVIATAAIPVDVASPSPVGAFLNRHRGGKAEALAIVNTGRGSQLCHVARSDEGWSATPLFGDCKADHVTACTAYPGTSDETVHGIFLRNADLHVTSLTGSGEWKAPEVVSGPKIPRPRVAYSPAGRAVIHGADGQGNLVLAYQETVGGSFTSRLCNTNAALKSGDYQLTMTSEEDWRILANVNRKPFLLAGRLGDATPSSSAPAPGLQDSIRQVVLGYWSTQQNTVIFLVVGSDNALHAWSQAALDAGSVQRIPNSSVAHATGQVDEDGSLHVYALDASNRLWVLHQSAVRPWNDDGTPNWAPILPIDQGVARLAGNMSPVASPVLFAVDGGDSTLRLHEIDEESKLWRSTRLMQASERSYEVTRFRTEIVVKDARGVTLPKCKVKVQTKTGESAVDVWAGGAHHTIDGDGKELETDVMGRLTVSSLAANGLACSNLVISHGQMPKALTVNPAQETHEYLAGQGTLHPSNPGGELLVFDKSGKTLAAAKVNGQTLAPNAADDKLAGIAAEAIRNSAMVATGTAPPTLTGFAGSFDTGGPRFHAFHSHEELHAYRLSSGMANLQASGTLDSFLGDIWEGIKNGVIAISQFVVEVANKTVELVVKIGDWISEKIHLAMDSLEKAAHFIAGIFEWVGAQIHKVVDWLKALFDFKAIWNTKMAIEEAILSVPRYVAKQAGSAQPKVDDWFDRRREEVGRYFDEQIALYEGKTFADSPNWQPVDGSSGDPIVKGASASDFGDNPHHNWLQDKIAAHAPDSAYKADDACESAWAAFSTHLEKAGGQFVASLDDFRAAIDTLIKNPEQFGSLGIAWLLKGIKKLVDAALLTCDAMVDALLGIVQSAMKALETLLTAELPAGPLNTLWAWMAEQAGHPFDGKLTMASLVSLFAAFPVTIIYKLIRGVTKEPFPNGKLPKLRAGLLGVTMPKVCREISCLVQMVSVVPGSISDVLGPLSPGWLTVIGIGMSAAVWILANGYPELSALQWAGGSAVAANLLWILPAVYFILKAEQPVTFNALKSQKDDIIAIGTSVLGVVQLGAGIWKDASTNVPLGERIANILLPLSSLFAFLGLTKIRANPKIAVFAIGAKVVINVVANVGGGAELLVSVIKSPTVAEA